MLRRCLVLLIFVGLLEPALACDISEPEPRELKVEIVQGLGGDCYYKRIPPLKQPDDVWKQDDYWRTEFYASEDSKAPVYTRDYYFYNEIVCSSDANGIKHISVVGSSYYINDVNEEGWLNFLVDGEIIKSYAPIDIIKDEENSLAAGTTCDPPDLIDVSKRENFVLEEETNVFVYQVVTLDNHVAHFDLLTGNDIPIKQPLDALLTDALVIGDIETAKDLLARGADPNKGNIIDGLPIYIAAKSNNIEMVRTLLRAGAETDTRDFQYRHLGDYAQNPLYVAAENGDLDVVELLWGFGADINQFMRLDSQTFQTPLDVAIRNNHVEVVKYLLMRGAELSDETSDLAKSSGNPEIMELISSHTPR
jgi:hypothetical protein